MSRRRKINSSAENRNEFSPVKEITGPEIIPVALFQLLIQMQAEAALGLNQNCRSSRSQEAG
jgi:hypothetical protein